MIFSRSCPQCGNSLFRRSHRCSIVERAASACGIRPYRCGVCGYRYHALKFGRVHVLGLIGLLLLVFLASLSLYSPLDDPNRQTATGVQERVLTYTPPSEQDFSDNR